MPEVDPLRARVKLEGVDAVARNLLNITNGINGVSGQLNAVGTRLTAFSAAIGAAMAFSVKAAIDFEQSMANVAKTVDATDEQIAALGRELQNMSERIPVGVNALAELASIAGQLGIQTENLSFFVETMAALGVSTNLSAQEAATGLAQFSNVMGTAQTDVDRLASVLVDLGNNLATTERDILALGQRLAGAGKVVGLTEAQIFGLAGALRSVGVEAEAGGTAISRTFIEIANAVADGSEKLTSFARVANVTVQEFSEIFKRDAAEALILFTEGLGRMVDEGENVFKVFDELGIRQVRLRDILLRSAQAGDITRESVARATKAWEENTAATIEAERFYATTRAELTKLGNQLNNVAIEIGSALLPAFKDMLSVGQSVVQNVLLPMSRTFSGLPVPIRNTAAAFGLLVAAMGPGILIVSQLTIGFAALLSITTKLAGTGAMVRLAGLIGTGGIIVAGLAATGIGVALLTSKIRESRDPTRDLKDALEGLRKEFSDIPAVGTAVVAVLENLEAAAKDLELALTKTADAAEKRLVGALRTVADTLTTEAAKIQSEIDNLVRRVLEAAEAGGEAETRAVQGLIADLEARRRAIVGPLEDVEEALRDLRPAAEELDFLNSIIVEFADRLEKAGGEAGEFRDEAEQLIDNQVVLGKATGETAKGLEALFEQFIQTRQATATATGQTEEQAEAIAGMLLQLERQLVKLKEGEAGLLRWELAQQSATAAQVGAAEQMRRQIGLLELLNTLQEQGAASLLALDVGGGPQAIQGAGQPGIAGVPGLSGGLQEAARQIEELRQRLPALMKEFQEFFKLGDPSQRLVKALLAIKKAADEVDIAKASGDTDRLTAAQEGLTEAKEAFAEVLADELEALEEAGLGTSRLAEFIRELQAAADDTGESLKNLDVEELVNELSRGARSAISFASGLDILSDSAAATLNSLVNLAEGAVAFAASGGKDIGAGIQAVSGLFGIIGGLFGGGESAEQKRLRQEAEQTADALRRLADSADAVASLFGALTGRQITDLQLVAKVIADAIQEAVAEEAEDRGARLSEDQLLEIFRGALLDALKTFGITLSDLEAISQETGIEISALTDLLKGNTTSLKEAKEEWDALNVAIAQADLSRVFESFAGQLRLLQLEFALFNVTDPIKQLEMLRDTVIKFFGPELAARFEDLDPEALILEIQKIFDEIKAGEFDIAQLRGLTFDQFLEFLKEADSLIDQVGGSVDALAAAINELNNDIARIGFETRVFGFTLSEQFDLVLKELNEALGQMDLAGLVGIDVGTVAGQNAARQAIQDLVSMLGDDLPEGIRGVILSLIGLLDDLQRSRRAATRTRAPTATAARAQREAETAVGFVRRDVFTAAQFDVQLAELETQTFLLSDISALMREQVRIMGGGPIPFAGGSGLLIGPINIFATGDLEIDAATDFAIALANEVRERMRSTGELGEISLRVF